MAGTLEPSPAKSQEAKALELMTEALALLDHAESDFTAALYLDMAVTVLEKELTGHELVVAH